MGTYLIDTTFQLLLELFLDVPLVGASFFLCTIYSEADVKVLDLHGTEHHGVEAKVVNFILKNETPLKIITGDSDKMRNIVFYILEEHGMEYHPEFYTNYGAFIVHDKTF